MNRFSKIAAALAAVPVLAVSGFAVAGSPGQLAGGDNYKVKNLTQNGSYSNTINANCNDEVQYSMQLSNTQFGALNNVTLKTSLPSNGGVSAATATTDLGGTSGTSDTVTVNLGSGQTQALVNGSTVLYNDKGQAIKTLPDTITNGVNIGTLNGSTTEFVNFRAKVNCAPKPPKNFTVTTTASATASATAKATCPEGQNGSATASASASATAAATATSTVSMQDAHNKAEAAAKVKAQAQAQAKAQASANAKAKAEVQCTTPTVTPVTPPASTPEAEETKGPEVLPNTGAGEVLGVFAGASAAGAAAHTAIRRFRR
jgi:hypothetical protein